jgi:hypothetical protein
MRMADLAFVSLVAVERAVDVERQHGIALPDEKKRWFYSPGSQRQAGSDRRILFAA